MAAKPTLDDVSPIAPVDITSTIAARLRELLAQGRFAPGSQITEQAIADAFQVSRGPVREALKRLTELGLLRSERNRGVFVPIMSLDDVRDIYLLRGAIESAALTRLVERPDPLVFARLREIVRNYRDRLQIRDWESADDLDMAFHRELVYSAGSRRLRATFDNVTVETRMCLRAVVFNHPDHPDMDKWHSDILDAAERGDLQAALDALKYHNDTVIADLTASDSHRAPAAPAATDPLSPVV